MAVAGAVRQGLESPARHGGDSLQRARFEGGDRMASADECHSH